MRRMKNSEFRIQNVIAIFFVATFYILHSTFYIPVHAQVATSPPPATKSSSLLQKLDGLKKEIASRAATLKNEVTKKISNVALLGQIKSVEELAKSSFKITIQTKKGDQVVLTNEYTTLQTFPKLAKKSGGLILKDLPNDQVIVALGDIDDKNNLNAKKIVKLEKYKPDSTTTVWGQVESKEGSTMTVRTKDGALRILQTTKNTLFKVGSEDLSYSEIALKRTIIAVGQEKPDQTIETRFVYMPGSLDTASNQKLPSSSPSASVNTKVKK